MRHCSNNNQGSGAIFTCGRYSIAIIWSHNSVYLFDSDSRNADSFYYPSGSAVLLKFYPNISLINYVKLFYENISNILLDTQYNL